MWMRLGDTADAVVTTAGAGSASTLLPCGWRRRWGLSHALLQNSWQLRMRLVLGWRCGWWSRPLMVEVRLLHLLVLAHRGGSRRGSRGPRCGTRRGVGGGGTRCRFGG